MSDLAPAPSAPFLCNGFRRAGVPNLDSEPSSAHAPDMGSQDDFGHQRCDKRFIDRGLDRDNDSIPIRNETYGKVAVFKDLYGNRIDLIEPRIP